MQSNHRWLLTLSVLTGFIFLTSCTQWKIIQKSKNEIVKPTISLNVDDDELKVTGKYCGETRSDGCITVGKWNIALITFKLVDSPGWYFTKFEICKGSTKPILPCSLEKWEQAETFATDKKISRTIFPDESGVIGLESLLPELTKFYVLDYNSVEQDFFYTIEACNGTSCVRTDPEIENKGRN